ncbi:hypothetical protein DXG03_006615 [Asterophora parasitica]|uniref:GPI anchored serine-rich protein n=1 Tax=Asterophora parasitica TaxID=117018 RepID=A0A9P7FZI9_9AGAR|nr:hypothetical protein DXG03_006615 [Asterophora parasitica]
MKFDFSVMTILALVVAAHAIPQTATAPPSSSVIATRTTSPIASLPLPSSKPAPTSSIEEPGICFTVTVNSSGKTLSTSPPESTAIASPITITEPIIPIPSLTVTGIRTFITDGATPLARRQATTSAARSVTIDPIPSSSGGTPLIPITSSADATSSPSACTVTVTVPETSASSTARTTSTVFTQPSPSATTSASNGSSTSQPGRNSATSFGVSAGVGLVTLFSGLAALLL